MLLFSKRYKTKIKSLYRTSEEDKKTINRFLTDSMRNRLSHEIKYTIESGNYIEQFLTVLDESTGKYLIHKTSLTNLTNCEIGYDLSNVFDTRSLKFNTEIEEYDDSKLLDFVEILLIFSIMEKRRELIARFEKILTEESRDYKIHSFMVIRRDESGLKSILPLIKERELKEKIQEFYKNRSFSDDHELLSQISADILQLLFSSPSKKSDTKDYSEELCEKVANKWTSKEKAPELKDLISQSVQNAKKWNNQITNIRHMDRNTVPIDSPSAYRLITTRNISIIEMVILSLPEEYIFDTDAETLKTDYFARYKINLKGWVIKKPIMADTDIDPDDIPF